MTTLTVIGGGLAGLTAAIACAEQGATVTLHEAHQSLGGRARCAPAPYITNDGTHAFYLGNPWRWLARRRLVQPAARIRVAELARLRFRHRGQRRLLPPPRFCAMVTVQRAHRAPVESSFREWATERFGVAAYQAACGVVGPAIYDADPGRLSAAFVFERLLRVTTITWPPATRYPVGGWTVVIARMAEHARRLGVGIHTGSRVTELPENGPVIIATSLDAAKRLLADDTLDYESGRAALLDIAITASGGDPFAVFDLDEGGFVERITSQDPALAPTGESLIQGAMPLYRDESQASGLARLEQLYDTAIPTWRDRLTWRRHYTAHRRTGAIDLPGRTWRDRPSIDQGNLRYLAGDMVAAPGLLAEVSINSALRAAQLALTAAHRW
jgi:hypothetical protein